MLLPLVLYINFMYRSLSDDAWRIVEKTLIINVSLDVIAGCGMDYWTLAVDNMSWRLMRQARLRCSYRTRIGRGPLRLLERPREENGRAPSAGKLFTGRSPLGVEGAAWL